MGVLKFIEQELGEGIAVLIDSEVINGALIGGGFAIVGIILNEVLKHFFSLRDGSMTLVGTAIFILLVSLYNYLPENFVTGFIAGTLIIVLLWWVVRKRIKQ